MIFIPIDIHSIIYDYVGLDKKALHREFKHVKWYSSQLYWKYNKFLEDDTIHTNLFSEWIEYSSPSFRKNWKLLKYMAYVRKKISINGLDHHHIYRPRYAINVADEYM